MAHRRWGEIITYNVRLRRVPMYPIIDDGLLMLGHILCPRRDSVESLTGSGVNHHLGRETNEGWNGKGTQRGWGHGHKQRVQGNAGKRKCVYSCQRAGIKGQSHGERSHSPSKEDVWVESDRWRWKRFCAEKNMTFELIALKKTLWQQAASERFTIIFKRENCMVIDLITNLI